MKLLARYSLGIAGRFDLSSLSPEPPLSQAMDRDGHLSNGAELHDLHEVTNHSFTYPKGQAVWVQW